MRYIGTYVTVSLIIAALLFLSSFIFFSSVGTGGSKSSSPVGPSFKLDNEGISDKDGPVEPENMDWVLFAKEDPEPDMATDMVEV
jgi:hypothetical protein